MHKTFDNIGSTLEKSGKINERFVFGAVETTSPQYQLEYQNLIELRRKEGRRVTFNDGLNLAKRYQPKNRETQLPENPWNPTKKFPKDLRKMVESELDLKKGDENRLLFWTTIGSIVDYNFGTDAVLELIPDDITQSSLYVRLDTTINPEKIKKYAEKHNYNRVIIGEIPDFNENRRIYFDFLRETAQQICNQFKQMEEESLSRAKFNI